MVKRKSDKDRQRLAALIDEATIDCYGEEEQHSGLLTKIEDNVECPFLAKVIGEGVVVTGFEWPKAGTGCLPCVSETGTNIKWTSIL